MPDDPVRRLVEAARSIVDAWWSGKPYDIMHLRTALITVEQAGAGHCVTCDGDDGHRDGIPCPGIPAPARKGPVCTCPGGRVFHLPGCPMKPTTGESAKDSETRHMCGHVGPPGYDCCLECFRKAALEKVPLPHPEPVARPKAQAQPERCPYCRDGYSTAVHDCNPTQPERGEEGK